MKLTTLAPLLAALLGRSLYAQQPAPDPLLRWMDQVAQQQLQGREEVVARIHNVADAERRKQSVRETLLSLIGGLPDYTGPLNPSIRGRIQTEKYTIEKVIFESLPGFYVTANLYRPNQPGRYPGSSFAGRPYPGRQAGRTAARGESGLTGFRRAGIRSRRPGRTRADLRPACGPRLGRVVGPGAHTGRSPESSRRRERRALFHLGCQTCPRLSGQPPGSRRRTPRSGRVLGRWRIDCVHRRPGHKTQSRGARMLH